MNWHMLQSPLKELVEDRDKDEQFRGKDKKTPGVWESLEYIPAGKLGTLNNYI